LAAWSNSKEEAQSRSSATSGNNAHSIEELRTLILEQKKAIEELKNKVDQQERLLTLLQSREDAQTISVITSEPSGLVQLASLEPMVPASVLQTPANVVKPKPEEKPAASALSVNGFKLSGDFRLRADAQVRSGNDVGRTSAKCPRPLSDPDERGQRH
jgi:hypothetical protein